MKKLAFFIFFIFFINQHAQAQSIPPIQPLSPQTERVAIVKTEKPLTEKEIQNIIHPFPDIHIRHIFHHAIHGFSIKGSIASITKLSQSAKVDFVSPVQTYKLEQQPNIRIIGGERVRGYFDHKNNRLTGKGVTVGIIDTGIDYKHPDLIRNYIGGYDFVDGDEDPMESKGEGHFTFHGTHVAGIIAADGRVKGVAPEAKIIAYRSLGPGGIGTTENIIAAIDQAIKDKVDILNLSLGNSINGPDLPINVALNTAYEKGMVIVCSSGNSGPNMWTVGSPGTAEKALSVGASTPPLLTPYIEIEGFNDRIKLHPVHESKSWKLDRSFPIVFRGLGTKDEMKDVKGKIVLVERGKLTFTEKAKNAFKEGAVALIIYNNTKGSFFGNLEKPVSIPISFMSKEKGEQIKNFIQKKTTYARTILKEEKDLLADFSSRGPVTAVWEIKPDVVAPGVAIQSTIPGGYLALEGTSMAAPHVSGACALIKQAHPDWNPEQIKAALMNTAKPLTDEYGKKYRTYEQGAGRIQIDEAIGTKSIVIPSSLTFGKFNEEDKFHKHIQKVTVENVTTKTQRYAFTIPKKEKGIEWSIPLPFELGPGEKEAFEIGVTVNPTLFKKKIFDGQLKLTAGTQEIFIPYLYVLEEPNYPRVMGFDFGFGDKIDTYSYEVYLPGGADEFGIALFEPDTFRFIGFLDTKKDIARGLLTEELADVPYPRDHLYLAKIFAKRAGKEDFIETYIYL